MVNPSHGKEYEAKTVSWNKKIAPTDNKSAIVPLFQTDMEQKEILQRMSETARRVLPEGATAWLFGSQARGTANSDPDWDILILLDKEKVMPEDHDAVGFPFREAGWDFDALVNPIIYTEKDWERNWFSPFYKNVMQERIRL